MRTLTTIQACIFLLLGASNALGQQSLDDSARALGFLSYQNYQTARSICLDLLNKNPLVTRNCGADIQCLQQEGVAMQQRYRALTQSAPWVNNNCNVVVQIESNSNNYPGGSSNTYTIEAAHNDELFIINGEKFEAQSYCTNMYEGDEVVFIEGSPLGVCTSASVVNLRTRNKCNLWCE